MSSNNFARLCEMEIASAPFSPSWRIMHDYAKLVFTSPLWAAAKILPLSISYVCANFSHVHAKLKNMVFQLLFSISPISFFWIHFHYLQFSSKAWSKCIVSSSSSTLCTFLHSISFLSLNASKITLKYLQNFTKIH